MLDLSLNSQLTDDGNVEITGRDLRERQVQARHPSPIGYRRAASLFLNGEDLAGLPLSERKARLGTVMSGVGPLLQYSDHQVGSGPVFYAEACKLGLEGIFSKRADAPYVQGNRGLWVKTKCLNREEFVVGWTDPEGTRPYLGALLLAYYDDAGRLIYAGRAGTGIADSELERLGRRLQPLAMDKMPSKYRRREPPLWLAAGAFAGALGPPGTRRRG